jgi:hypothetical protein
MEASMIYGCISSAVPVLSLRNSRSSHTRCKQTCVGWALLSVLFIPTATRENSKINMIFPYLS